MLMNNLIRKSTSCNTPEFAGADCVYAVAKPAVFLLPPEKIQYLRERPGQESSRRAVCGKSTQKHHQHIYETGKKSLNV
jgi:hypothetical protein